MKRILILLVIISYLALVSADPCTFSASLINQDPYPAVPGEYVKLVFQLENIDTARCGDITFELLEDYPIKFNPGDSSVKTFKKLDYIEGHESNILVPYEVIVDPDALDGENPIEARIQSKGDSAILKTFNLEVQDTRANFEAFVKDYKPATDELTIEVLNIADTDIKALTVEIPKQDGIIVKGASRVVVGDLDSNEYTTATFESVVRNGELTINLIYSDAINVRRTAQETIVFDSSYFEDRVSDKSGTSLTTYLFWIIVIGLIAWWFIKRRKAKKARQHHRKHT